MMGGAVVLEIEDMSYATFTPSRDAQTIETLRIEFTNGNHAHVPNGDFSVNNPALCVMAFLGVSPSTMEEADGELLPIKIMEGREITAADFVIGNGKRALKQSVWGPDVEDGGSAAAHSPS